MKHFISIVLFLSCYQFLMSSAEETPKYAIHYDRMETLNDTDAFIKFIKFDVVKEDSDENIFKTDISLDVMQDLGESFTWSITLFKLNDQNEYETFVRLPIMNTCAFMKSIYKRYFYETISKYSNFPHYDVCPFPQGQYYIKDLSFNMNTFERIEEHLGLGSYRLDCVLINNDVTVSGSSFYGSITEKS